MTENTTAKYIKFWYCVTFSALFFNRRHFRSGNDNLRFLAKLSLLYAFQANSSIGMFIVSEMTENPTAKYIKCWFCVTFSALFFNRRHFRSGNDNLTFLSKLSLLYAFQANSSIGMFIVREMTVNPTGNMKNFGFVRAC